MYIIIDDIIPYLAKHALLKQFLIASCMLDRYKISASVRPISRLAGSAWVAGAKT